MLLHATNTYKSIILKITLTVYMNKPLLSYLTVFILLLISQISFGQRFWVAAGASNWNNTANWSTTSGGAGGASVPGPSDAVTFNANGLGNCTLDVAPNVAGITVNGYTGVINLNGFNLTTTGTNSFVTGTINNTGAAAAVTLNTTGTSTFSGTTFGANVNGSTGRIFFNGSVFNGSVTVTKTANNNDTSTGGNTFSGSVTLTNSSTAQFRIGGTNPDIFNGTLALVSGNTGPLEVAYSSAANQINNNITVTYNATGLISIGAGGGTATLAATRTISVAGFGGSGCGNLTLARLTQAGATGQNISLGGNDTATLTLGPASNFNGALTISTPSIIFNSSTFQAVTVTKTGSAIDNSRGGNTFNGVMTVNNQGGDFAMGTNAADAADTWNANAFFINTGGNRLRVAEDNAGNLFNGNATFTNTSATDVASRIQVGRYATSSATFNGTTTFNNNGNASDVHISYDAGSLTTFNGPVVFNSNASNGADFWVGQNGDVSFNGSITINSSTDGVRFGNGVGTVTMSAGNTIALGGSGFTGGRLLLRNFTQAGNTAMTLPLTGSSTFQVGPNSAIGGNANFSAPRILTNGVTYGGTAALEKTGGLDDASIGNNIFNGATTITNSGSGYLLMGNGNPDQFNANTTFNNNGSYRIFLAYNHAGQTTSFAADLTLNSNKTGGVDGWSYFIAESANTNISVAGNFTINCAGALQSNHRILQGAGTTASFGGDVAVNLTNTQASTTIQMGVTGTTTYNGNIAVVNSGGASGVYFNSSATASSTLAATKAISIGAGGFSNGTLNILRFTQLGSAPTTLNLTGTSTILHVGPLTTFGGNTDLRSPQLYLDGVDVGGTAYLEKTDAGNNTGIGNNTFSSTTTIVNSGTGYLRTNGNNTFNGATTITNNGTADILLELASGSTYNGDVTFTNTNSSYVRVAYLGATSFNGNITVNSTAGVGVYFSENVGGSSTLAATKTISVGGSGFSNGILSLLRFSQIGATPQALALTGNSTLIVGPNSAIGGNANFSAPRILTNGVTYGGTAALEKTGGLDDASIGNNIFNGATTITNSGSGYLLMGNGNPDQFNANTTFNNNGSYRIFLAYNHAGQTTSFAADLTLNSNKTGGVDGWSYFIAESANTNISVAGNFTINCAGALQSNHRILQGAGTTASFGGDVAVNLTNTQASTTIQMGVTGTTTYNGNIAVVNSGGASGVYFNSSATASSTLAATKAISIGAGGFSNGTLNILRFTQLGSAPTTLNLTGTSTILHVGPLTTFGGNTDLRSPQLYLDGVDVGGTAYLEKTDAGNNTGIGNNTFSSTTTIVNSGTGYLRTNGNNTFNGATTITNNGTADILLELASGSTYNGDVTFTNTNSSYVRVAYLGATSFNGNITVNSTAGVGVYFSENVGGSSTLAATKTISVGGSGFSNGILSLLRFSQIGATPQALALTGNSTLIVGPTSAFDGNVNFSSPRVYLNGCTYGGTTYLEKTGATNNDSSGGNTFNGSTTIANSGAGWFRFALTGLDTFNGDLTLTNTGSSTIRMADNTPGTVFNGNIIVNSTFGGGIYFSESGGGTATLASGRTISVGGLGFSLGELRLRRFTQNGGTPQNLVFTGTAGIVLGPSIIFNGAVDFRAPQVFINSGSYNSTAFIEKTGASDNQGSGNTTFQGTTTIQNSSTGQLRTNGGNTFNGVTTLINSGSNDLLLELVTASVYNNTVTMTNTGSSYIRPAYIGSNTFNGDIIVNSTNGTGIYFCENAAGSATLASGRTISVGGTGFTAGELRLQRFTQFGATAQTLVLTGAATLRTGPAATWNGNVTASSPLLFLDGATFNAVNSFTKTGASTDASAGGNVFVGASTFINSGTGVFRLGNAGVDEFIGAATFNQASGTLQPAYNSASNFYNNVTVDGPAAITFGANNGTIVFAGGAAQNVNKTGAVSPIFRRLTMSKSGNSATLNTDASVTVNGTFTTGVLRTTATNILNFANGATVTGGSNASHIDGPVRKTGTNAFSFPTGDGGFYRPISISAPSNAAHFFTAEYFKASQAFGGAATYPAGIVTVSSCEYWMLDRNPAVGGSNVSVTLSWNTPDCTGPYITNPANLRVVRWNGTAWVNHGNGGTTGTAANGTVISAGVITSFSPITLGSSGLDNPLPVELLSFNATAENEKVNLKWITASELNNDFFTVQHSTDGVEFTSLGNVAGQGTKQSATTYNFVDASPMAGINYYRLKQTDFDGTSSYSNIIAINLDLEWLLYPNPATYGTDVTINKKGNYAVYNNLGVLVIKVSDANKLDISSLAPGIYTVRSSNGSIRRLVVK
jgi:hypothetical protein